MKIKLSKIKFAATFHDIRNEESGAVLVVVTLVMVTLMVLLALVIDIGSAYLRAGQLQKAADAAVISAGRMLPVKDDDHDKINAIKDSAINYAKLNGFNGMTRDDIILGNDIQGSYTNIKVTADADFGLNFARIIGVNSINIAKSAQAMLTPTEKTSGAAPLGIFKSDLDADIAANTVNHITLKYGSGDGTRNTFGALDLTGQGGASNYSLFIAHGYPGEISLGDILVKESGNMVGPTYDGFTTRYNSCTHFPNDGGCTVQHFEPSCPRVAMIVVYDYNDTKSVKVVGFAAFILEAQDSKGQITGSFVKTLTAGQGSGSSASATDYGYYSLMLSE